jgi:hypothetical protein
MRGVSFSALAGLILVTLSAASARAEAPKDVIVGTWSSPMVTGTPWTWEYRKNGEVVWTAGPIKAEGTWKFTADDVLVITFKDKGNEPKTWKFSSAAKDKIVFKQNNRLEFTLERKK